MPDEFSNEKNPDRRFDINGVLNNEGGADQDFTMEVPGRLVGSPYGVVGGKERDVLDALGFRKDDFPLVDVPLKAEGQTNYSYRLTVNERAPESFGTFSRWRTGVELTNADGTVQFDSPELLRRLEGSAQAGAENRFRSVTGMQWDDAERYARSAWDAAADYVEKHPNERFNPDSVPLADIPREHRAQVRAALASVGDITLNEVPGELKKQQERGEAKLAKALRGTEFEGITDGWLQSDRVDEWRDDAIKYGDSYIARWDQTTLTARVGKDFGVNFDPTPSRDGDMAQAYAGVGAKATVGVLQAWYDPGDDYGITAGGSLGAEARVGGGYVRENDPGWGGVRGQTSVTGEVSCGTDTGMHYIGGLSSPPTPGCEGGIFFRRTF